MDKTDKEVSYIFFHDYGEFSLSSVSPNDSLSFLNICTDRRICIRNDGETFIYTLSNDETYSINYIKNSNKELRLIYEK